MPILRGRVILHHTADTVVVQDQVPPHRLTTEELNGLFFSDQDEKAIYFAAAQIYAQGDQSYFAQLIEIYGFDDGSSIATKAEVTSAPQAEFYEAELTVIGGTSRFAGISGLGQLKGWSNGYNARHDIEITYSK